MKIVLGLFFDKIVDFLRLN